jgi:hypothetical protein
MNHRVCISSGVDAVTMTDAATQTKEDDMFPTLSTLPSALALATLTTDVRLAAILHRQMHLTLPVASSKHAAVLMKIILLSELTFLFIRLVVLVLEFLLLATARAAGSPLGASLLTATAVCALAGDLSATSLATAALTGLAVFASRKVITNIPTCDESRHKDK